MLISKVAPSILDNSSNEKVVWSGLCIGNVVLTPEKLPQM